MIRPTRDWTSDSSRDDWDYWASPLSQLRSSIERVFSDFGRDWSGSGAIFPPINLSEDQERYRVEAEVPGIPMNDLEITCTGSTLTLRGERKDMSDQRGAVQRQERVTGSFARTIELPGEVDANGPGYTIKGRSMSARADGTRIELRGGVRGQLTTRAGLP